MAKSYLKEDPYPSCPRGQNKTDCDLSETRQYNFLWTLIENIFQFAILKPSSIILFFDKSENQHSCLCWKTAILLASGETYGQTYIACGTHKRHTRSPHTKSHKCNIISMNIVYYPTIYFKYSVTTFNISDHATYFFSRCQPSKY